MISGNNLRKAGAAQGRGRAAARSVLGRRPRKENLNEAVGTAEVICTYCERPAENEDHVPPECLFPKPRPKDLVTVPSCINCNRGFSKDDEYLKQIFILRHDISEQPRVRPLVASLFRTLQRPKAKGYAALVYRNLCDVSLRTPAGLHLGTTGAFNVDLVRARRTLARITRGLFRKEIAERLPLETLVTVQVSLENEAVAREQALGYLGGRPVRIVGRGAFRYAWVQASDSPTSSLWLMEFFDAFACLGITVDPNSPAARARGDCSTIRSNVPSNKRSSAGWR
jgi:hypothetical protein